MEKTTDTKISFLNLHKRGKRLFALICAKIIKVPLNQELPVLPEEINIPADYVSDINVISSLPSFKKRKESLTAFISRVKPQIRIPISNLQC